MRIIFLSFMILEMLSFRINAQSFIEGRIVDVQTNDPLISVGIQALHSQSGTITDLDGKFKIKVDNQLKEETLIIRYIGYKERIITLSLPTSPLSISLEPKELEIGTVVILPQENPALRLIRLASLNSLKNHPERFPCFSYKSYNKMVFFPKNIHNNFVKSHSNEQERKADSIYKTMYMLLWESVTERKYKFKGKSKEIVLASKISGLQGIALPFSPTDIQDLSFYDDWVKILDVNFLSPIASSAIHKYRYQLKDTLFSGSDTIYTITFEPRKNTFNGFSGNMKLHSRKYAIQSIEAMLQLNDQLPFVSNIRIKQIHQLLNDSVWFPHQLDTDFEINLNEKSDGNTMTAYIRSGIQNVDLNTVHPDKLFNPVVLEVEQNAGKKSDKEWQKLRPDTLTFKEKNTYKQLDSLGQKFNLSRILSQTDKLMQGTVGIKFLDLHLRYLYNYNPTEKHRLGIGIGTNEKVLKWAGIMGWLGYGTGDNTWKRGAKLAIHPFKNPNQRLSLEYKYDLVGLGTNYLGFQSRKPLYQRLDDFRSIRQFYYPWMDYSECIAAHLFLQTGHRFQHQLTFRNEHRIPAYDYTYAGNKHFKFTEISITSRWGIGENFVYNGFRNVALPFKKPVLEVRLTQGLDQILGGTFTYQKAELAFSHTIDLKGKGKLSYFVTAGIIEGRVPISQFYFFYANANPNIISEPNGFNTMSFRSLPVFAADRYTTLHINWQINNNGFPSKKYSPDPILKSALAWGTISPANRTQHESFTFRSPEQGYQEAGLAFMNIVPPLILDIIPSFRFLGVGCYMLWGHYMSLNVLDNFAVKIEYQLQF